FLLPLWEKVARQGRMRGLAPVDESDEAKRQKPLIRLASRATFSHKGRRMLVLHPLRPKEEISDDSDELDSVFSALLAFACGKARFRLDGEASRRHLIRYLPSTPMRTRP
ncbi:hypothetical protein, partial [Brevundimonas sp.]|uniref:hypothetical protein n=1 Tax=Brevundimonas sp. TaxID=1871086 RepID=UPI00289EEDD5